MVGENSLISGGGLGADGSFHLYSGAGTPATNIFGYTNTENNNWMLGIGTNFGVDKSGNVYVKNIIATGGKIGSWSIGTGRIESYNIHLLGANYSNYYPSSLVNPEGLSYIRIYEGATSAVNPRTEELITTECSIETTFRFTNYLGSGYIITGWNTSTYSKGYQITNGTYASVIKVAYSGSDFLVTVKPTTSG